MPNMSTMDGDNDTISDPVAVVVVAEPVNESDNVGATSMMQQPNLVLITSQVHQHKRPELFCQCM